MHRISSDRLKKVILDMIPEMGGGEVFDRMKAFNLAVRIILSSEYNLAGQAKQITNRGCSGFLQNTYLSEDISMKMREVVDA